MGDLDSAWTRRGLVSPAPWGATLADPWLDATVTFKRQVTVRDGFGGFSASTGEVPYLTTVAHVRFVAEGGASTVNVPSGDGTPTNMRRLDIRFPWVDATVLPKKGDSVVYVLDTGSTLELHVSNVFSPRGFSDHIKVETEWFE